MQINLTELARKHPLEFEILEKNLILEESVRRTKKENDEMLARIRK